MEKMTLARGTWKLVAHGIARYVSDHGCRPAVLILHPAHRGELVREMKTGSKLIDGISIQSGSFSTCPLSPTGGAIPSRSKREHQQRCA